MGAAAGGIMTGAAALLGATKKQSSSTPSAAAAPTQTPQQAELSQYVMPALKDWMTNPPKVNRPAWNPTNVNTGAAKSGFTQGQWVTSPKPAATGGTASAASQPQPSNQVATQAQSSIPANVQARMGDLQKIISSARAGGALNEASRFQTELENLQHQYGTFNGSPSGQPQGNVVMQPGQQENAQTEQTRTWQPGTLNIADAPTLAPTMGTLGQFEKKDYSGLIDAAGQPMTDRTGQINQFMQGLTVPQALSYQNELEPTVQNRLTQNMDRTVQEGYDANYLKELAAQGLDPLQEAFDNAMKSATADYNRRGMSASGFEFGQKFGTQPDSITKNYLKSVGDVTRDVALKGAEAARADRFTNAGMRDQALAQLANLSQTQNANQLNRLNMDTSRQLQEKNLQQQGIGMLTNQDLQNRQIAQQRLGNTMSADQSNESNRQWWANMQGDQQRYDQQNQIADWQRGTDMAMKLSDRADQNAMTQIDRDAEDQKTNIGYEQQGLNNITNFINGQQATANNAQQNYWNAAQMQQQAQNQQQAQQLQAMQGLGGLFTKQAPVQTTVPQAALTPNQFQGYQQAGNNFMSGLQQTMNPASSYLTNFYNAFAG